LISLCWILPSTARAQQPFVTDDADVTDRGKFHFELSSEYDLLQRSAAPFRFQSTTIFSLDYGLFKHVEVGVAPPLIMILGARAATPRRVSGIGDVNFHLKYNFYQEHEDSRLPALTVDFNVELPTGNARRQLGSGLTDYFVNGVLQKSLSEKTKLRLNGGTLFAGNQTTGVIGIRTRGLVFTGGGSLVKQFTPRLDLGVEVTGALTRNFSLSRGQLQAQVGGNYALRKNLSLDFGLVGGRFAASPRAGAKLGVSLDF
jgi:hypothetical protein